MCENPDLWNDTEKAQSIMKDRTRLDKKISSVREIEQILNDNVEMIDMAEAEGDAGILKESRSILAALKAKVERRQLESLLSGEADGNDCYLQINAGAGGTEAQD